MKLSILFKFFQGIILVALGVTAFFTINLYKRNIELHEAEYIRFQSSAIAAELKQSSDDLTRYARAYVVTGNDIWEKKYWEVLDIRNGKLPRPDGRTIALNDSIVKLGITTIELDKLILAEYYSNQLVNTERKAFNAMQGLLDDGTGNFTATGGPNIAMAQGIMFNQKYLDAKVLIMNPIYEFLDLLDNRTYTRVQGLKQTSKQYLILIISLIALILLFGLLSYFFVLKKIFKEMRELERSNELVKQKNQQLSRFTFITSHSLQEPLNTILAYSNILSDDYEKVLKGMGLKSVHVINKTALKMKGLIKDLLEHSKIGKTNTGPEEIDVHILLKEIEKDLAGLKMKSNTTIRYKDLPKVFAYKRELKILFFNIIENAMKYSKERQPSLVKIMSKEDKDTYTFSVEDNGIGFHMKFKTEIFNLFYRLHTEDKYSGTGIGLSNCQKIVELHKGRIWVDSAPNKGSKFSFTISKEVNYG